MTAMTSGTCAAALAPHLVGDPVDTLTGAVIDKVLDFRLTGPLELNWHRSYDSSRASTTLGHGFGQSHHFHRSLTATESALILEEPVGLSTDFPRLRYDGEIFAGFGATLRRISLRRYAVFRYRQPAMEFEFMPSQARARLSRLFRGAHEVRLHYDDRQRLCRIVDSRGRRLAIEEDDAGRVHRVLLEQPAGPAPAVLMSYFYDESGNLIATENGQGHGHSLAYDQHNRLVQRRGRKGFTFHFRYDERGRCVVAMGDERLYGVALEYVEPGRRTLVRRPDGGIWAYSFDPAGRLHKVTDPMGGVQQFVRDPAGRQLLELDGAGNVRRFLYNAAGEAIASVDQWKHREAVPADPNARHPKDRRRAANPAEYEYGALLDVQSIQRPTPAQAAELGFGPAVATLIRTIRPEQAQALLAEQTFKVSPLGIAWWPSPARGRMFSDLGKLTAQVDEEGRTRRWHYDPAGNLATYVDFDGSTWHYDYGRWHFLEGTTNPVGSTERYTYNWDGEVASFCDPLGTLSEYRYDPKQRLIEVLRNGKTRDRYVRDPAGNLLAKFDSSGQQLLRFTVGPGSRPLRRELASGDVHEFEYDCFGRIAKARSLATVVELSYDLHGNLVKDTRNGVGVIHEFAGRGACTRSVVLGKYEIVYQRQPSGDITIIDPAGGRHLLRVRPHGLVERVSSNGSCEVAQYDGQGRCLFKRVERNGFRDWTRQYHWSGEGRLQRIEDSHMGDVRHAYDAAHRLRERQVSGRSERYGFDAAHNLTEQPGLSGTVLADGNRLVEANGECFHYDGRDHVMARQGPKGETRYTYDSRDMLVRAETPDGTLSMGYDALGRRTHKDWNGLRTDFHWSADQLLAERRPDGSVRIYVHADPLSLTPVVIVDYESADQDAAAGKRYAVYSDQVGAPVMLEAQDHTEAWQATIRPFGKADIALATTEFNLRFPGHYEDIESGLHCNRFRHYDPTLGRYLQSDPWGITGGGNLYAYRANPLLHVDTRGLGEGNDPRCHPEEDAEGTRPATAQGDDARPPLSREEGQRIVDAIHATQDETRQSMTVTTLTQLEDGRMVVTNSGGTRPAMREEARRQLGNDVIFNDERRLPNGQPNPHYVPPAERPHSDPNATTPTHGEGRGMQAADQAGSPADRQWSAGSADHGGAACPGCEASQARNGVTNETGFQSQGGRFDRGGGGGG